MHRYRQTIGRILKGVSAKHVNQINVKAVTACRDKQLAERIMTTDHTSSPRTVNMEVGALSTTLAWGVKPSLIGSNPLKGVARKQRSGDL